MEESQGCQNFHENSNLRLDWKHSWIVLLLASDVTLENMDTIRVAYLIFYSVFLCVVFSFHSLYLCVARCLV